MVDADSRFSLPAFSRSGRSNAFGKNDDELKTHIPEVVKAQFVSISASEGVNSSEHLREVIIGYLHGAVPNDMRDIVWEYVTREVSHPLLLKMLHQHIFGVLHEFSLPTDAEKGRAGIGTHEGGAHENAR